MPAITIHSAKYFTTPEIQKLNQAMVLSNRVWDANNFWDAVAKAAYYDHKGAEVVASYKRANLALDLYIYSQPWYKRWSSETAVENADGTIGFERRYFARASLPELVNTIVHEVGHRAGFGHDYKATVRRPKSVPYLTGALAEIVAAALIYQDSHKA